MDPFGLTELGRHYWKTNENKKKVEEQEGGGLLRLLNPFTAHYNFMKGVEKVHNFIRDN